MPPKVSVIIFEDNIDWRETEQELLEREGHKIIGVAGSIESLKNLLSRWTSDTTHNQQVVALIDNQAPWKDDQEPDPRGVGRIAEQMILRTITQVTTIAVSSGDEVNYGDYRYKPSDEKVGLGVFVSQLPAKER